MRKISFVLAAVAVTGLTVVAKAAPETTLFFDIRDNSAGQQSITTPALPFTVGQGDQPNDGLAGTPAAPSGGGMGCGQVLRLAPVTTTNAHSTGNPGSYPNFDADNNASTGALWLYADVGDDAGAVGTGDVISSIGVDIGITAPATPRNQIASSFFSWQISDPSAPVNFGFSPAVPAPVAIGGSTSVKYVKVPVDGGSMYATAGGLTPSAMYRIARLDVTAATRDCAFGAGHAATGSTYNVFLSVNNLLITRTFSNVVADAEERVSFGYFGGAVDADVSGNTVGGAGNRDAIIQVRVKGDNNGTGNVNFQDLPGLTAAQNATLAGTPLTQVQRYLFDRNNNGAVNFQDLPQFSSWQNPTCP